MPANVFLKFGLLVVFAHLQLFGWNLKGGTFRPTGLGLGGVKRAVRGSAIVSFDSPPIGSPLTPVYMAFLLPFQAKRSGVSAYCHDVPIVARRPT